MKTSQTEWSVAILRRTNTVLRCPCCSVFTDFVTISKFQPDKIKGGNTMTTKNDKQNL